MKKNQNCNFFLGGCTKLSLIFAKNLNIKNQKIIDPSSSLKGGGALNRSFVLHNSYVDCHFIFRFMKKFVCSTRARLLKVLLCMMMSCLKKVQKKKEATTLIWITIRYVDFKFMWGWCLLNVDFKSIWCFFLHG